VRELAEVRAATHHRLKISETNIFDRNHRHDLLREHIERAARQPQRLDGAVDHAARDHGGLQQVPAVLREDAPLGDLPHPCPARPMRCRPDDTAPGDSTSTTRSTAPMSMPSSSELVATMARMVRP
jgi:hypothetical protein